MVLLNSLINSIFPKIGPSNLKRIKLIMKTIFKTTVFLILEADFHFGKDFWMRKFEDGCMKLQKRRYFK